MLINRKTYFFISQVGIRSELSRGRVQSRFGARALEDLGQGPAHQLSKLQAEFCENLSAAGGSAGGSALWGGASSGTAGAPGSIQVIWRRYGGLDIADALTLYVHRGGLGASSWPRARISLGH